MGTRLRLGGRDEFARVKRILDLTKGTILLVESTFCTGKQVDGQQTYCPNIFSFQIFVLLIPHRDQLIA